MLSLARLNRPLFIGLLCCPLSHIFCFSPSNRGSSRFFLDSADREIWDEWLPTGIFHGISTTTVLLEAAGESCTIENVQRMSERALLETDEFICQAWGSTVEETVSVGLKISEPSRDKIVVMLPVTKTGTQAASLLIREGVRVCMTACYTAQQALIAANVGADYVAPCLGRLNDASLNGAQECSNMLRIVDGLESDTRILIACLRDSKNIAVLSAEGHDTFSISPDVAAQLFNEPLTDIDAKVFEESVARNGGGD